MRHFKRTRIFRTLRTETTASAEAALSSKTAWADRYSGVSVESIPQTLHEMGVLFSKSDFEYPASAPFHVTDFNQSTMVTEGVKESSRSEGAGAEKIPTSEPLPS